MNPRSDLEPARSAAPGIRIGAQPNGSDRLRDALTPPDRRPDVFERDVLEQRRQIPPIHPLGRVTATRRFLNFCVSP